ncbi:MAG: GAK system ATP-grasp enzyme [Phycisphaerales bacterium]|nr:GAK system ATP-grasp enzyme [Phycisphaerales bacterium]
MSDRKRNIRIGVVGVKEGWSSERLADVIREKTGFHCLIDLGNVSFDLTNNHVLHEDTDLSSLDAIIVKKLGLTYRPEMRDRLEVLRFLHERGVRVFSKPSAIMGLLDRLSCTVTLQLGGIPMPETVVTENIDLAVEAVSRFERAVLKPLFTSKARGMCVVEPDDDRRAAVEAFRDAGNSVIYIQKMVPLPGSDLGVVFLGGEYIGSYARVAHGTSWNTSTHHGGKYRNCKPEGPIIDIAHRAQALFGLDLTCVDVVESPTGPLVFEVSAFGGFRGLLESDDIDVAEKYVDYVLRELHYDD